MDIDSLLQPFHRFGVKLGLEPIKQLLANLDNPHEQVPVIHVGGTNGKGSVCAYLSSVLTEAGYRTGRYTSPHLLDWTERICVNEQPILREELYNLILEIKEAANPDEPSPTQFEVITAAAWLYFARQKVDIAVIEVGLGGRLDATNVCEKPLVSVITSIGRDHWQQLGSTIAEIAGEKAGIFKPGCPIAIGSLPPDAEQVMRSRSTQLQCPVIAPQPARQISPGWAEYNFDDNPKSKIQNPKSPNPKSKIQNLKFPLPLQGEIQLTNSALAIATLQILKNSGWEKITEKAIVDGMAKTKWLGRLQWITWNNRKLLLDGAHNTPAAIALRQFIDSLGEEPSVGWVMGMFADKDHADIFGALLRPGDKLYLVPISVEPWAGRTTSKLDELTNIAKKVCPELADCQTYPDLFSGLSAATSATPTEDLIVLCGSLYLVGDVLQKVM